MPDYSNQGYDGAHQPPGYISPAEANEIGLKKSLAGKRPTHCREGRQQILCPPFMDDKRIAAVMEGRNVTREQAEDILRQEWLQS